MDRDTGVLKLAASLDYETKQNHTLVVAVTDGKQVMLLWFLAMDSALYRSLFTRFVYTGFIFECVKCKG